MGSISIIDLILHTYENDMKIHGKILAIFKQTFLLQDITKMSIKELTNLIPVKRLDTDYSTHLYPNGLMLCEFDDSLSEEFGDVLIIGSQETVNILLKNIYNFLCERTGLEDYE